MKKLHIAKSLSLPIQAITEKIGILGATGSGKTTTASVLVEELLKQQLPVEIVDPTDAWWGLRSSKDGKEEGFPVTVLGGDHGDVPLEETAGLVIADLIASDAPPLVISTANFSQSAKRRFMTDFLERLYQRNRRALHLVLDETDEAAPQDRMMMKGGGERLYGAVNQIVRRGRIRGIGVTMISQRSAEISKSILSQCSILFAHRASHPTDMDPIIDWMKHNARDRIDEVHDTIASLAEGEAWVMSPQLLKVFDRFQVRDRETFNSSKTPEPGERAIVPKRLAKPDLALLQEKMRDTIEKAKANDPALLRRRVAELERNLAKERTTLAATAAVAQRRTIEKRVEIPVLKDGQVKRLEALVGRLEKFNASFDKLNAAVQSAKQDVVAGLLRAAVQPRPIMAGNGRYPKALRQQLTEVDFRSLAKAAPPPAPRRAVELRPRDDGTSVEVGKSGLRRMLIALAQRPQGLTNRQLGVRAGVSSRSGTFGTYLGRARSQGWISGRGHLQITEVGTAALGSYEPLPEGPALAAYWLGQLGNSGAARMLRVILEAHPNPIDTATLGERAAISSRSGTFGTYLGRLRALELVEGRGELRASDELV